MNRNLRHSYTKFILLSLIKKNDEAKLASLWIIMCNPIDFTELQAKPGLYPQNLKYIFIYLRSRPAQILQGWKKKPGQVLSIFSGTGIGWERFGWLIFYNIRNPISSIEGPASMPPKEQSKKSRRF